MSILTIFANFPVFKLGLILEIEKSSSTAGISLRHSKVSDTYRTSHAEVFMRIEFTPTHYLYTRHGGHRVRHWAVDSVHVRYMLSPVRLSSVVCNARAPYSGGSNFRQYFYGIRYLGHPLTSAENLTEVIPGEPLRRGS